MINFLKKSTKNNKKNKALCVSPLQSTMDCVLLINLIFIGYQSALEDFMVTLYSMFCV